MQTFLVEEEDEGGILEVLRHAEVAEDLERVDHPVLKQLI
jgi:hypothetical protein